MAELAKVRSYDKAGISATPGDGGVAVTPELAMSIAERDNPPPDYPPVSTMRAFGIIACATAAMSLSGAGAMSLSIALPQIMADLSIPESQLQWISSAFALTNGCFLLLAGRLADVYGRKWCFVVGITWNAIWTLVGGFMHSTAGLVVTRALAGMGSAASVPSAIGILATTFHGTRRSTALAAFSAGGPVGGGLGLIVGGLLTAYTDVGWRAALWCFAGTAAACAILGFLVIIPDRHLDNDRRVDWIGAVLITCGLVLLQFSISYGPSASNGWKTGCELGMWHSEACGILTADIIALIIVSVLLIAAFFAWEHHVETRTTRPPLMSLGLWTRSKGKLAAMYLIGGISWMGFTTFFYNTTLFYQEVQHTGVIGAMLRFLPTCICGVLCNVLVAKIVHLIPGQILIAVGIMCTGIANVFFAISPADVYYWGLQFNAMWLAVLGADFLMAVGSIFVSTLALPSEQSVAGALFQTLVQLGGALGLAFVAVVQTSIQRKALDRGVEPVAALLQGLHGSFWFAAGTSFAAMLIAAVVLRKMGRYGKKAGGEGGDPEAETAVSGSASVSAGSEGEKREG